MHNITLIGMPGSGKTTFGKTLAAGLSYHFIDTDDVIIQTYHKPLMELIDEYGTEGFITLEGKVLQSIYTNQAVISTGGSAVYSDDAMQYLKSTGIVIYLHHQLDVLTQRVGNLVTRGVVCHSGCTTLEDLYEERCPLYEKYADLTVDFTGCSVEQCSEKPKEYSTDGNYDAYDYSSLPVSVPSTIGWNTQYWSHVYNAASMVYSPKVNTDV